ncbi:hypothetical protein M422DRAFT_172029 [Sphaerobolus stellatus SS14]|uniref:DDE Tnp4 domain-containing protein n=1 Tax=Sphaerobolus stellatus (strain SS14) TaxID=990650 RepID=A0A0C9VTZ2_SPHS4|nr:hypothetical protein M422DRAFT_172029 [Sphaerobolus stellatus SS14]
MPRLTTRQESARLLAQTALINLFVEGVEMASNQMEWSSESSESEEGGNSGSESESDIGEWEDIEGGQLLVPLSQLTLSVLQNLYSSRFLEEQRCIPRTSEQLLMTLGVYKQQFPDIFKSFLRIQPNTFDQLLRHIKDHPVFHNRSNNVQIPVDRQLAVALYRFGHFGNAASLTKVACWAGMGYGTVNLCMRHVLSALCDQAFRQGMMRWPTTQEIEEAKQWVKQLTCAAWRNGWSMVDGTLVPLFARPGFYGNSWYDRKSSYSMNVQLISLPNLHIIDYGVGLPGSQHDAAAWKETRIPQEHEDLLSEDEWVWGDSAYPLQRWCQAPYKNPRAVRALCRISQGTLFIPSWPAPAH